MSQIKFRAISLQDLVEAAPFIVQATYQEDSAGAKTGGKAFTVVGILNPDAKGLETGQKIRVWDTSAQAWGIARMHERQSGIGVSPLVDAFEGGPAHRLVSGETYVLFLHSGVAKNEYVFEAEHAFVEPARFEEFRDASAKMRWMGQAADAKAGAVLKTKGMVIYIKGLAAWPRGMIGKKVTATGLLVRKKIMPDPGRGELTRQGAEGKQWVLRSARWKLI